MSFWLKKLLHSFRVLPLLFGVIIGLLSVRLILVFSGIIPHKDLFPISNVEAAEKQISDAQKQPSEKEQKEKDPQAKDSAVKDSSTKDPASKDEAVKESSPKETMAKDSAPKEGTSKETPPAKEATPNKDEKAKNAEASESKSGSTEEAKLSDIEEEDEEFSPEKIALLLKLKNRNQELDEEHKKIKEKSDVLKTIEHKIDEKYKELDQKRLDLEKVKSEATELTQKLAEEDEKKLQSLVKIYQSMKPKDAARIFDGLDMRVLLDVLSRMKEANAGTILANMSSDRAKNVTLYLAAKRKTPQIQ